MRIELVNLTPHEVTVYTRDGLIREINPSGTVARVASAPITKFMLDGIPVVRYENGEITDLPAPVDGVHYIVSTRVAQAAQGRRTDLLVPDGNVTVDGRKAGCRRFRVW